jgi:hypothetical protein
MGEENQHGFLFPRTDKSMTAIGLDSPATKMTRLNVEGLGRAARRRPHNAAQRPSQVRNRHSLWDCRIAGGAPVGEYLRCPHGDDRRVPQLLLTP